jgi:phenylacetate-CoA ligase
VEIPDPGSDNDRILSGLQTSLSEAHEGLRFAVRQVDNESLPRFELKAKRVLDEREIAGGSGERKQT